MSEARRLLLLGGVALAIWGMGYGLWYAAFAEHQALDGIGGSLTALFSAGAQNNEGVAKAALDRYKEAKYIYDRQVDAHGHWIGLALLLVVIGVAFDRVSFSERVRTFLAAGLLGGAFVFPLGVLLETFNHGPFPRAVAIAGSAVLIASLALAAVGFARENRGF